VLLNLISNEIKFTQRGGNVKVISSLIKNEKDLFIKDSKAKELLFKA